MPDVLFRTDASTAIGSGHVMRCLTLAHALRQQGWECHFVSRLHPGHMLSYVAQQGFRIWELPCSSLEAVTAQDHFINAPEYAAWLGVSQQADAEETGLIAEKVRPNLLVVDHYALDFTWELKLRRLVPKILVIDDLADRKHDCTLLLDQTLGRAAEGYKSLTPPGCKLLCGAKYALLRPEFRQLRNFSLSRRKTLKIERLLITLGGVDKDNATSDVLQAISDSKLPDDCSITIVMGKQALWKEEVIQHSKLLRWSSEVLIGVNNMAQLMAISDISIGAAGSTSWERCCLGLPTAMLILAKNQEFAASRLEDAGAVHVLHNRENLAHDIHIFIDDCLDPMYTQTLVKNSSGMIDGEGVFRVINELI